MSQCFSLVKAMLQNGCQPPAGPAAGIIELSIIHDLHAVIPAGIQQDRKSLAGIANEVKQFSGVLFWIAASASPPRNDGEC